MPNPGDRPVLDRAMLLRTRARHMAQEGRVAEAARLYKQSLDIARQLAEAEPDRAD